MRVLLRNYLSLTGLQIANYLLPFITLPFIVRVIEPDKFGLVSFAQAFVLYFVLIVNYGFDLSATRQIAINRHDIAKVSKVFWTVISVKTLLFLSCLVVFISLVFLFPRFANNPLVYLVTFLIVPGYVLFPTWLFQGFERLTYLAIFNFLVKAGFTAIVFVFLRNEDQYLLIPATLGVGQLAVGVGAFFFATRKFGLSFQAVPLKDVLVELRKGSTLFISMVAISFYTTSNTFILGLLTSDAEVGYYSAAAKVIVGVQALIAYPISQTVYPRIGTLLSESREKAVNFLRKLVIVFGCTTFIFCALMLLFASPIIDLVLGDAYDPSIVTFQLLAFVPFIISLSNVSGIQTLVNFGYEGGFLAIVSIGALLSILLNLLLVPMLRHNGTALSWLITEIFITISCYVYLHRKKIFLLPRSVDQIKQAFVSLKRI